MMAARGRPDQKRKRRSRPGVRRRRKQAIATALVTSKTEEEIVANDDIEVWLHIQTRLEIEYLRKRAEQQLGLAQLAIHTAAVAAHVAIAEAYLERVVALEQLRQLSDLTDERDAPGKAPSHPSYHLPLIQGDDR